MRIILSILLPLAYTLAGFVLEAAEPSNNAFLKGPYLQNPGTTEITIMWTTKNRLNTTVHYGIGTADTTAKHPPDIQKVEFTGSPYMEDGKRVTPRLQNEHVYTMRLKKLKPGQAYVYVVDCGTARSGGTFTTVPSAIKKFSFIVYGDSRNNPVGHAAIAKNFRRHDPRFILNTGDMVGSGTYAEWGPEFFAPLDTVIRYVPLWPARGNHERNTIAYRQLFSLPGNELWYSFDFGNAHIIALDSVGMVQDDMLDWLEKDLAQSEARWKFVFYHHPSYDFGSHRSRWGRETVLPILREHGADMVFTGHSHVYERFFPLYTPDENSAHPITHITTGGGGAPTYQIKKNKYLAACSMQMHYVAISINGDTLTGKAITPDGTTIDTFSISKPDGKYSTVYLKQAFPESDLDTP